MTEQSKSDSKGSPRLFSLRFRLLILLLTAAVPVTMLAWSNVLKDLLEFESPRIELQEMPRGIGQAPVALEVILKDFGAGLDEIVVRLQQDDRAREILRRRLDGKRKAEIKVNFFGEKSNLEEGQAYITIRAFDRSFWNNRAEKKLKLNVDFRKPHLEGFSTQHNARRGGSQLVFYKVSDANLAVSGVKVGNQTFLGLPARSIDPELEETNLFVALYGIDITSVVTPKDVRLFAEDKVGNATSIGLPNQILPALQREVSMTISDEFLEEHIEFLAEQGLSKLQRLAVGVDLAGELKQLPPGLPRLLRKFALVTEDLWDINSTEVASLMDEHRFERYWSGSFSKQRGAIQLSFGDRVNFSYRDREIGNLISQGYEVRLPRSDLSVTAANDGIVMFTDNIGIYGRMLAIDHGLGLTSVYGRLENVKVDKGELVKKGEEIGVVGRTGFSRNKHLYFEIRVHGLPVNPLEWLDRSWHQAHVTYKINQVKTALGIPIYREIE